MKDYKSLKVKDLPEVFQKRIERFNKLFEKGTEDHHDFEHHFDVDEKTPGLFQYEMFCIETALAFAELIPTKEAFDTFMDECEKEYKENPPTKWDWETDEDYQERINGGPGLYEVVKRLCEKYPDNKIREKEHSGNTMGASWFLFRTYISYPELVQYAHGSLAPLVGDEGYYDDRSDLPEIE